ncbi:MAG: hypothetical protein LBU73_05380 [Helicobacteraceae bacterium]|nr:hypothetical protein [Helicobacteraceae bacterium]
MAIDGLAHNMTGADRASFIKHKAARSKTLAIMTYTNKAKFAGRDR